MFLRVPIHDGFRTEVTLFTWRNKIINGNSSAARPKVELLFKRLYPTVVGKTSMFKGFFFLKK